MPEFADLRLEKFAHMYIECGCNGTEAIRTLWPGHKNPAQLAYQLRKMRGMKERIDDIWEEEKKILQMRTAKRLQKIVDLPSIEEGAGEADASAIARAADVAAKYNGANARALGDAVGGAGAGLGLVILPSNGRGDDMIIDTDLPGDGGSDPVPDDMPEDSDTSQNPINSPCNDMATPSTPGYTASGKADNPANIADNRLNPENHGKQPK